VHANTKGQIVIHNLSCWRYGKVAADYLLPLASVKDYCKCSSSFD